VPTVPILREAILAARRQNCFATAVRVFAGLRSKVENEKQYKMYCEALKDVRDELGIPLPEELGV
jgi:cytochrome c oxidase subunit 5a